MNRIRSLVGVAIVSLVAVRCGGDTIVDRGEKPGTGGRSSLDGGTGGDGTGGGSIDFGDGNVCPMGNCDTGGGSGTDGGDASVAPYCGDGALNQSTEVCDDGNSVSGDGCSEACAAEAGYACPNPGEACVKTVICGDGKVAGDEQCDDKNTKDGDGCDKACALEPGWACPFPALRCVPAKCGDSLVVGVEECDDGGDTPKDGCDENCRLEDGFKCDEPGKPCTATSCRDGKKEGTEQCDDANFDLGDGCSPFCKLEPDCSKGACVSACGDGVVLGNEACDDGNVRDGDGCSAECKVELGFRCTVPPLPDNLNLPLVIRDVTAVDPVPAKTTNGLDYVAGNHVDFEIVGSEFSGPVEDGVTYTPPQPDPNAKLYPSFIRSGAGASATGRGLDLGRAGETFDLRALDGTLIANLSLSGKPVYGMTRAQCDKTALPTLNGSEGTCTATVMDADSFHTWYVDHDVDNKPITWPNFVAKGQTVLKTLTMLHGSFNSTTAAFTAGGDGYTFDSRYELIDGSQPPIIANSNPPIRTRGFFPIDELGLTGSDGTDRHDFHFTSEVRFWFEYDSSTTPQLNFSGDDDVFVYVNGHLALDIGGIHGRAEKNFVINAANATAWGLADGKVYEIAVFQAERNVSGSNYWLTLKGFNASKSVCESVCGDGIIASDELCDDGDDNETKNPPGYGKCGPDCKTRGPNCGDGKRDVGKEECDDGVNASVYDFDGKGCAPGCVRPPNCGDGEIQGKYEQCDDGKNDGSYGTCNSDCKFAPRCGDRKVDRSDGEACDDGPSGSSSCSPTCERLGPR